MDQHGPTLQDMDPWYIFRYIFRYIGELAAQLLISCGSAAKKSVRILQSNPQNPRIPPQKYHDDLLDFTMAGILADC